MRTLSTWLAGTCSSQTVCQIPEDGVYVSPPGLLMAEMRCLPFGCAPSSLGSYTLTRSSTRAHVWLALVGPQPVDPGGGCSAVERAAARMASVRSTLNRSELPVWLADKLPLTHTAACQSTASKRTNVRVSGGPGVM